jgi:hypothetical protein
MKLPILVSTGGGTVAFFDGEGGGDGEAVSSTRRVTEAPSCGLAASRKPERSSPEKKLPRAWQSLQGKAQARRPSTSGAHRNLAIEAP